MKQKRVCVFAHYDQGNEVDEYVYYYLNALNSVVEQLVFVTVSSIPEKHIERLQSMKINVIKRENIGYDFYSYKVGIETLNLSNYDELILCNDSVFGPFLPLEEIMTKMQNVECDFWGITASQSIDFHMQSYFMVFKRSVIESKEFLDWWNSVEVLNNKNDIIRKYEVGLSQFLFEKGFVGIPYIENIPYKISKKNNIVKLLTRLIKSPYKIIRVLNAPKQYWQAINRQNTNTSLAYWEKLLGEQKMPFLKKSLFTNHQDATTNLKKLQSMTEKITNYPYVLIINYLKRIQ